MFQYFLSLTILIASSEVNPDNFPVAYNPCNTPKPRKSFFFCQAFGSWRQTSWIYGVSRMEKGDPTVDVLNVEDTVKAFDSQYMSILSHLHIFCSKLIPTGGFHVGYESC